MADREQPYDPYIPSAGGNANAAGQGQNGNHRTAALQAVRFSQTPEPLESRQSPSAPPLVQSHSALPTLEQIRQLRESPLSRCDRTCSLSSHRSPEMDEAEFLSTCPIARDLTFGFSPFPQSDSFTDARIITGNRQHSRYHARQHQQSLRTRCSPRYPSG